MKIDELQPKPKEELGKLLEEKKERLRQLRFDLVSGKVKNVKEIREIKKDIARILTLIRTSHFGERSGRVARVLREAETPDREPAGSSV